MDVRPVRGVTKVAPADRLPSAIEGEGFAREAEGLGIEGEGFAGAVHGR